MNGSITLRFTKMHGCGNISDRHFGVGSDGLIVIEPAETADLGMRMFNPDGSEAEMCGNGIRGFAKYVYEHGLTEKTGLSVQTGAGLIGLDLRVERGRVMSVRVDMGQPRLARSEIPMSGQPASRPVIDDPLEVAGRTIGVTCVSMGNPHCVSFVDDVDQAPVSDLGPQVENHPAFPARTNVEFVQVLDRDHVRMRVWERGAGETLACGTGACAALVACVLNGLTERAARVYVRGGALDIEWAEENHVCLTGPAAEAFTGELSEETLGRARV